MNNTNSCFKRLISFIIISLLMFSLGTSSSLSFSAADDSQTKVDSGKGMFTLSAVVSHPFGAEYVVPEDKTFSLSVELSGKDVANKTFPAKHTDGVINSVTTDSEGVFRVELHHNDQLEVFGLSSGTVVSVKGNDLGTGFTQSFYDNGNVGDGVVTVVSDKVVSVIALNTYTPQKLSNPDIFIVGRKFLEGRKWNDQDKFDFELQKWVKSDETSSWITLASASVSGTDQEKIFDFNKILCNEEFAEAGIYYYRVVEKDPGKWLDGISYDKSVHSFAVHVTDKDMDGYLEIFDVHSYRESTSVEENDTGYFVHVDFFNVYEDFRNTFVTIDINKIVDNPSGSSLASPLGFEFELYNENNELVLKSRKTTDRGFTRMILDNLTEPGEYHYYLKESPPDSSMPGWTYSEEVIPVTIIVYEHDGILDALVYMYDDGAETANTSLSVDFTNTYAPEPAEFVFDMASVQLTGRDTPLRDSEFEFAVRSRDGDVIITGKNDANGKIKFEDNIIFTQVGIYFFNITETSDDANGVITDKNTYRIAIEVSDVGGTLQAHYEVVNTAGDSIVFVNTYDKDFDTEPTTTVTEPDTTAPEGTSAQDSYSSQKTDVPKTGDVSKVFLSGFAVTMILPVMCCLWKIKKKSKI